MMQTIRLNINKIKKCAILLISVFCSIAFINNSASATINTSYDIGTGDTTYHFDKLLNDYKTSSFSYQRNVINLEIEIRNGELAAQNYNTINGQYSIAVDKRENLQKLKELYLEYKNTAIAATDTKDTKVTTDVIDATDGKDAKAAKDAEDAKNAEVLAQINSQIETIDAQIEQYNSTISSLQTSKSEASLQDDINQFYRINKTLVEQEAQNKLINDFLKKSYGLILLKEQQEYNQVFREYLETSDKVENIKYRKGISEVTALELSEAKLLKNKLSIEKNKKAYSSAFTYIQSETKLQDNVKISLPLSINQKEYNLEQTITLFENNNSSLVQLQYLKKCYQSYWHDNHGTYSLHKQIELRIQDYQLQCDDLKFNIKAYVSTAISSYNESFQNLALAEKELQLANKYYSVALIKKDHKKATQLEVDKASYEINSAKVSYYQSIYNIIIWQNILDNHIYGETP